MSSDRSDAGWLAVRIPGRIVAPRPAEEALKVTIKLTREERRP
jgi:hypothetical protein